MAKIDLQGLQGLKGSAIGELRGMYSHDGYSSFIQDNAGKIDAYKASHPGVPSINVSDNLYVTQLIKDQIGEEEYKRQGFKYKSLEDKIAYYNGLFPEVEENPIQNIGIPSDIPKQEENIIQTVNNRQQAISNNYTFPSNISVLDERMPRKEDGSPYSLMDIFAIKAEQQEKEGPTFNKESKLDDSIINTVYGDTQIKEYAKRYYENLISDKKFAYDLYKQFNSDLIDKSRFYKHAFDYYQLPITEDDMLQTMSRYFALKDLKGEDYAIKYAQDEFQTKAAEHQGWFFKNQGRFGNVVPRFVNSLVGDTASFFGIISNMPRALYRTIVKDGEDQSAFARWLFGGFEDGKTHFDIPGVSGWTEFWGHVKDNSWTTWGNDLMATGSYNRATQAYLKQEGLNWYEMIRKPGHETDFFDWNTPYELIPDMAHTIAAMYAGSGEAALLKGMSSTFGLKAATSAMASAANMNKVKTLAVKAIDTVDDALILGTTGLTISAPEASMDAGEIYTTIKKEGNREVYETLMKMFQEELDDPTSNLYQYVYANNPVPLPNGEVHLSPEENQRLADEWNKKTNDLITQYRNENYLYLMDDPEIQRAIEQEARRASAINMTSEVMYIGLSDLVFTNVLGKGVKAMKKELLSRVAPSLFADYTLETLEDGTIRAVAKKAAESTAKQVAKGMAAGAVEAASEGVEEGYQNVVTRLNEDLSSDYIRRFVEAKYNGESVEDLSAGMFDNLDVALNSLKENLVSEETFFSFMMGAVSAGLGTPTFVRGGIQRAGMSREDYKNLSAGEKFSMWWRNPGVETYMDNKRELSAIKSEEEHYNQLLANNPELLSKMRDGNAVLSWIMQQDKATQEGDELELRNAMLGQHIQTIMMVDKIAGTSYSKAYMRKLEALSKLSEGTTDESKQAYADILSQARVLREDASTSDEELAEDIRNRAKKELSRVNKTRYWANKIDNEFGYGLDTDVKEGLVFNHVMISDWEERLNDINKSLFDTFKQNNPNSHLNQGQLSDAQNAIAKYGNLETANKALEAVTGAISVLEGSTSRKEKGVIYKSQLNELKRKQKSIKKEIDAIKKVEGEVLIEANDIMALNPSARAAILNEKNIGLYSTKQKEAIEEFKRDNHYTDELADDIRDAGRIQDLIDSNKERLYNLRKSKGYMSRYAYELKSDIARRSLETRLADSINAESYEDFKTATDKFLTTETMSDYERAVLDNVLKKNRFYGKYLEESDNRNAEMNILDNSPEFNALNEQQKALVRLAYKNAVIKGNVSSDALISMLDDEGFKDFAKKNNIDLSTLNNEERQKLAETVNKIFSEISKWKANRDFIVKQFMKKQKEQSEHHSERFIVEGELEEKRTTFDSKRYTDNKEMYDNLFSRLAEYFKNKKAPNITKQDFIDLLSLFIDEPIDASQITDFDVAFNREDLQEVLDEVTNQQQTKEYTQDISQDKQYDEMAKFERALKTLINLSMKENTGVSKIIERAIKEVNKDFRDVFVDKKPSTKLPKLDKVGTLNSKRYDRLKTEAEKKWYEDNHIRENREKLASLFGANKKDAVTVFINDQQLVDSMETELGELNNDNYPLVMAVRVPSGTEGATTIDGQDYLPIGLLQDSRATSLANNNVMNEIRDHVISKGTPGIVKNTFGRIYESKGVNITVTRVSDGSTSIRDFFLGPNGKYTEELRNAQTDAEKSVVKSKIVADFTEHLVKISTLQHSDKRVVDDNGVEGYPVTGEYEYIDAQGHPHTYRFSYVTQKPREGEGTHKMLAYIDEKQPDKPILLFVNSIQDIMFDEEGSEIYDVLTNEDLRNPKYADNDINIIRKAVNTVYKTIADNLSEIIKDDVAVSQTLNKRINNHLNLLQSYQQRTSGQGGTIQLRVESNGEHIFLYAIDSSTGEKIYGLEELAKIPIKDFKENKAYTQIQLAIRDLIFQGDKSVRTDKFGNAFVKLQVDYKPLLKGNNYDEKYVRYVLFSNLLKSMGQPFQAKVDDIGANETIQQIQSTGDPVKDAVNAIAPYSKSNPENKKVEGSVGVTTFIQNYEESAPSETGNTEMHQEVAKSLGTAIDRIIRELLNGNISIDDIVRYAKSGEQELYTLPGFSGKIAENDNLKSFIKQVAKAVENIQKHGETIVKGEFMFSDRLIHGDLYADITAEPDLITVDKNGNYHIYDFKTFYNMPNTFATVRGKSNPEFRIFGLANADKNIAKWTDQLSLYKDAIEKKVGSGKVVELGVIPIRLSYNRSEAFVSEDRYPTLEVKKVFEKKGENNERDKALKLDFSKHNMEDAPATRIFNDIIAITPVSPTSISSKKWQVATKAEQTADALNQRKEQRIEGTQSEFVQEKPATEMTQAEILAKMNAELGKILGDESNLDSISLDESIMNFDCEF